MSSIFSIEISSKQTEKQVAHIARLERLYKLLYYDLLEQRQKVIRSLQDALLEKSTQRYHFSDWFRTVKYEYSLHPLSSLGSLKLSGRFNCGDDMQSGVNRFSSLYIAEDKETSLSESLGVPLIDRTQGSLSHYELSLSKESSEATVAVEGELNNVFELDDCKKLIKFVNIIKKFKVSPSVKKEAQRAKIPEPQLITKPKQLYDLILKSDWRKDVVELGLPSTSQIFGSILCAAPINGVAYPSKHTDKGCLAIFPDTFDSSNSFISLRDQTPSSSIIHKIDKSNCKVSEMTYDEVVNLKNSITPQ